MNHRRLTLIDVLQPQAFGITPERARVTRTIVQPDDRLRNILPSQRR